MSGEFNLIEQYFVGRQKQRKDVHLAAGDDCALVKAPENVQIAISTDTLVAGTHFLPQANPAWVAHKALASNISDLAAMGASPAWVSFALTMPSVDEGWLKPFCDSFFELADYYGIQLIGGDTTKGPLSLTLTVQGFVAEGKALRRDGAQAGDWIYVTGDLGESKAGLDVVLSEAESVNALEEILEQRHYLSTPRVLAGQSLTHIASSAIDISDGLISDLKHILNRSQVGAEVELTSLPVSPELVTYCNSTTQVFEYALTSGEEYELCFTVPEENKGALESSLAHARTPFTCIGQINGSGELTLLENGKPSGLHDSLSGFDHFKD
ncbi:thiamine-phosphate kinase [Vibrio maerlii]|uniref:thiamine-phosphate kinase n=1 Tax=Vibrio maerlii TaxID=2231648 RepID=UPI000E3E89F5|nr:thiamine-phosphate kinase [Vibrio maerlii]